MGIEPTCEECGSRFEAVTGGVCARCGRMLCSRHLRGWRPALLAAFERERPVCVSCRGGTKAASTAMLLIALSLPIVGCGAQASAASPLLDGTRLRASVDTLITILERGGKPDTLMTAVQTFTPSAVDGRDVWVQVFRWKQRDGTPGTDSLVLDRANLQPIVQVRVSTGGRTVVRYDGTRVRETVDSAGKSWQRDTTLPRIVYSSSAMDVIARAFADQSAQTTDYYLYYAHPGPSRASRATYRIITPDAVRLPGGRQVSCWVVRMDDGDIETRFWIKQDDRVVVQIADGGFLNRVWTRRINN